MAVFVTGGTPLETVNFVDHIQSTGTQYVDLELSMPKGFHVVCDIEFTNLSGFNAVIGAHDPSSPYNRNYLATNGTGWEFGFLGVGSFGSVATNTRYEVDACNISGCIFCKINGVSQSFDTSGATGTARSSLSLYALAMNYSANLCCARAKLRGMKVYADAGYTNLLRDLWPCYDPDGIACLYDKVEKKYYYNAGTGDFIAGEAA